MICIIDNKICHFDELPENYPTDRITDHIDEEEFFYYNQDLTSFTVRDGKFVPLKPLKVLQERSLSAKYIPSETASIKALFCILPKTLTLDAETKLSVSGLYDTFFSPRRVSFFCFRTWIKPCSFWKSHTACVCFVLHSFAAICLVIPSRPLARVSFLRPVRCLNAFFSHACGVVSCELLPAARAPGRIFLTQAAP